MGLRSLIDDVSGVGTKVLGVAAAALLIVSSVEGYLLYHQVEKTQKCADSITTANKVSSVVNTVVAQRDNQNVQQVQQDVSSRINDAIGKLRAAKPSVEVSPTSSASDIVVTTNQTSVVLPSVIETDKEICTTNTIIAEGWQKFYSDLQQVRTETDAASSASN